MMIQGSKELPIIMKTSPSRNCRGIPSIGPSQFMSGVKLEASSEYARTRRRKVPTRSALSLPMLANGPSSAYQFLLLRLVVFLRDEPCVEHGLQLLKLLGDLRGDWM